MDFLPPSRVQARAPQLPLPLLAPQAQACDGKPFLLKLTGFHGLHGNARPGAEMRAIPGWKTGKAGMGLTIEGVICSSVYNTRCCVSALSPGMSSEVMWKALDTACSRSVPMIADAVEASPMHRRWMH